MALDNSVSFRYMLLLSLQPFLLLPLFIITTAPTNCHYYCDLNSMRRRCIVECKFFCYQSPNWAPISRLCFRKNFPSCKENCSCDQRWTFYIDGVKEAWENVFSQLWLEICLWVNSSFVLWNCTQEFFEICKWKVNVYPSFCQKPWSHQ